MNNDQIDVLIHEHAKAIAELDETENQNIELIIALREVKKLLSEIPSTNKDVDDILSNVKQIVTDILK